jgi:nucleoside-diphosphate-sugar epimerase
MTGMIQASANDSQIEELLSAPPAGLVESVRRLDGDFIILGVGGKMGATIALMLRRALNSAGKTSTSVTGVSRFSSPTVRQQLEAWNIRTLSCDLTEPAEVAALPAVRNVLYLAGQKFGTTEQPERTWIQNTIMPGLVARHFRQSRIVVFSTGCVYPLVPVSGPGSRESDPMAFVGEYASTCIGRERVFTHFSREYGTPVLLFRLNYSVEFRYGVLVDIALNVWNGTPVDVTTGWLNCIWQGDACARAIACLEHTASPPRILNVTGREKLSVRILAEEFGRRMGRVPVLTGKESDTALLSDSGASTKLFGLPSVSTDDMIGRITDYVRAGGRFLGKPTHFEIRDGAY